LTHFKKDKKAFKGSRCKSTMSDYNLTRLSGIELDDNTPECVLMDLLSTCKKKVSPEMLKTRKKDIIKCIVDFERMVNKNNPELRYIATYVSAKPQSWTHFGLWRSFVHIQQFLDDPFMRKIRKFKSFEIGDKTEQKPNSYDSIMLYKILQENDISYGEKDNPHDMMTKINDRYELQNEDVPQLSLVPEPEIKKLPEDFSREETFQKILDNLKFQKDIDIYLMSRKISEKENFDFSSVTEKEYRKITKEISTHGIIYKSCLEDSESVMYAMRFFSLDLTESENPTLELKTFCRSKMEGKKYKPVSPRFREKYSLNKTWYNTDKTWKPLLSSYYSQKSTAKIIEYNGGGENDTVEFLDNNPDNFFQGIPLHKDFTKNIVSHFDKKDLGEEKDIISYGSGTEYIYFTPDELKHYLEEQKDFNLFSDKNKQIPLFAIRKLKNICRDNHSNESYSELYERIKFFMETGKPTFPLQKELFSHYFTYQKELETHFKELWKMGKSETKEEFDLRREKVKISMEDISQNVKNILFRLPSISDGDKRFFREKEHYLDLLEDFQKRNVLVSSSRFYHEELTGEKISIEN